MEEEKIGEMSGSSLHYINEGTVRQSSFQTPQQKAKSNQAARNRAKSIRKPSQRLISRLFSMKTGQMQRVSEPKLHTKRYKSLLKFVRQGRGNAKNKT